MIELSPHKPLQKFKKYLRATSIAMVKITPVPNSCVTWMGYSYFRYRISCDLWRQGYCPVKNRSSVRLLSAVLESPYEILPKVLEGYIPKTAFSSGVNLKDRGFHLSTILRTLLSLSEEKLWNILSATDEKLSRSWEERKNALLRVKEMVKDGFSQCQSKKCTKSKAGLLQIIPPQSRRQRNAMHWGVSSQKESKI